jgi:hypothetical protein
MYQLRDQTIELDSIVLESARVNYLGPNLVLRQCKVLVRTAARSLVITRTSFLDCDIVVKKPLRNFSFCDARLERCVVAGTFFGCDFGRWVDDVGNSDATVVSCDFSGAKLDACRFIDCDVDTLIFPLWPCFTILDPVRRCRELEQIKWPGRINIAFESHRSAPPATRAITYYAPELTRRLGGEEEDLKDILEGLQGVVA